MEESRFKLQGVAIDPRELRAMLGAIRLPLDAEFVAAEITKDGKLSLVYKILVCRDLHEVRS